MASNKAAKVAPVEGQTIPVQKLKREYLKSGQCGMMLFLLPFEAVAFLTGAGFVASCIFGKPFYFILIFFFGFHFVTQCAICGMDPMGVMAGLSSLSEGITDDEALKILQALRDSPPEIEVLAEAYRTESHGTGKDRRTRHITVHIARNTFQYASFRDTSVCLTGLGKYSQLELSLEPTYNLADEETKKKLAEVVQKTINEALSYTSQVRSRTDVHVKVEKISASRTVEMHSGYWWLDSKNIFATRSPGVKVSGFWSPSFYMFCCCIWPLLGTLYRILYLLTNRRYVLPVQKVVSVNKIDGPGWKSKDEAGEAWHHPQAPAEAPPGMSPRADA